LGYLTYADLSEIVTKGIHFFSQGWFIVGKVRGTAKFPQL